MSEYQVSIKRIRFTAFSVLVFIACLGFGAASAGQFHEYHSIYVDPGMKKTLGDKEFDSVMAFFHDAEAAIEKEDIDGLMALYSDRYSNGDHDKKGARAIWGRIFQTFDNMAAKHNMRIDVYDKDSVIVRCSGLLMGVAKGEKYPITVDSWVEQDHILAKEGSNWRLVGTTGKDRKRLWFDKPMHPLF